MLRVSRNCSPRKSLGKLISELVQRQAGPPPLPSPPPPLSLSIGYRILLELKIKFFRITGSACRAHNILSLTRAASS